MKLKPLLVGLAVVAAFLAVPADAEIDEIRVGGVGNIRNDHGDIVEGKHEGANIEIEIVSSSPDLLNLIGSPRPYLMGSIATDDGGVSFGGVGVLWRWEFADGWAFEPGFGYISFGAAGTGLAPTCEWAHGSVCWPYDHIFS